MWHIIVSHTALKNIAKLPKHVGDKYVYWSITVQSRGPHGLRDVKSFHDEALTGKLKGKRSSRLNDQWRVIYTVEADIVTVYVERIGPHDY